MSWESHRTQVLYEKYLESLKEDFKGYLKSFLTDIEKVIGKKVVKAQTTTGAVYGYDTCYFIIEDVFLFDQNEATINLDIEIPEWFGKKWGTDEEENFYDIVKRFFNSNMLTLMNMKMLDTQFKVDTLEFSW